MENLRTLLEEPDKEADLKHVKMARAFYRICMDAGKSGLTDFIRFDGETAVSSVSRRIRIRCRRKGSNPMPRDQPIVNPNNNYRDIDDKLFTGHSFPAAAGASM